MKIFILIFIGCLVELDLFGQIATVYGSPIKWSLKNDKYVMCGVDTLTNDSILITHNKYLRKNIKNSILEELIIDNSLNICSCSDDGMKATGYWKSYFETGEIKEIGKISCNQKIGEWLYFYKNGRIQKYENYLRLDITDYPDAGFLAGDYIEYHENGIPKQIGNYKLIEVFKSYPIVDIDTYEIIDKCCSWQIESVKYGIWRKYDTQGIEIENQIYDVNTMKFDTLRELTDKFTQMNINGSNNE